MKKINPIILLIEIIGAIVVFLVGLALVTLPVIHVPGSSFGGIVIYALYVFAVIVMLVTIFRHHLVVFGVTPKWLVVSGIVLLATGTSISYCMPEFFSWAVNADSIYWFRVSVYSIPAICIEGATFTLFIAWFESRMQHRGSRENALMIIMFVLYATFTVTTNFLAINKVITVPEHVIFSKFVTAFIGILTIMHIVFRKQNIR